ALVPNKTNISVAKNIGRIVYLSYFGFNSIAPIVKSVETLAPSASSNESLRDRILSSRASLIETPSDRVFIGGCYRRQREYPQPPPPIKNTTRITINKVSIISPLFGLSIVTLVKHYL